MYKYLREKRYTREEDRVYLIMKPLVAQTVACMEFHYFDPVTVFSIIIVSGFIGVP